MILDQLDNDRKIIRLEKALLEVHGNTVELQQEMEKFKAVLDELVALMKGKNT